MGCMIAKIAVAAANFAIDKPYSYSVPKDLTVQPGCRVSVPFGKGNRRTEGVVLSLESGDEAGLKAVERILDETPVLDETMLRLAAFLRQRYFCTFYEAARAMLPAGLWFREKPAYALTEDRSWKTAAVRQADAKALLELLEALGGQAEETALAEAVPEEEKRHTALRYLVRKKWVSDKTDFLRRISDKTEKIATLACAPEEAMEYAGRCLRAPLQRSVLELMCGIGSVSVKELCYYTGASSGTVKRLADLGYLELTDKPVLRCSQIKPAVLTGPLELSQVQQAVFSGIREQMMQEQPGVALLHGVTGSGKTAVYLKLIRSCLDEGKSALLLVPEIALTPQLLSLLAAHFGNKVAVQHSSLAATERYDQWKRIRAGEAAVVVGTRSAVFAPCSRLGMIILDEEQEHSYKSENNPRYSAAEVALWRGAKEKNLVLLGSATPSVETMYRAKTGVFRLYTLNSRYNGKALPRVQIVDMRQELKDGNDLSLSRELTESIAKTHMAGNQTILFLNRRGNSRALLCVDCGEAPECPRCSARLTYHSANNRMMCHYCGFSQPVTQRCPSCNGPLKPLGTGTQKVQQELQGLFPDMPVIRMDADTVSAVNTHEKILDQFQQEKIPVLVGTQMVAKGLNLPKVTLVGVLDADMSLYAGSYRAAETTFNMLTQVVGRAGRGETAGEALIQSMSPGNRVLQLAARQDYEGFYEMEIQMRRVQKLPPFGDVASVTFLGQDEGRVLRGAAKFRDSLSSCLRQSAYLREECEVLGPAPCVVPRINYNYRYRLTLRCKMTQPLRELIAHLLRQFSQDSANRGVSAFADVNGYEE
ncbi:MAG: primosomal protein N' [Oscillospiraceae bacterium]|nr:primosomal protein N' [Oscillospiraceae bacterium]